MDQFTDIRASGKIAMKLDGGEKLIGVNICTEKDDIMLSTKDGKCIRFPVEKLRVFQSRNSTGVRGIKLGSENEVVSLSVLNHAKQDSEVKEKYLKIPLKTRLEVREAVRFNKEIEANPSEDLIKVEPMKVPNVNVEGLSQEVIENMAENEEFIFTITVNGFGKRTSAYEYRITNRGGGGVTNIVTSKRNGSVIASFPIEGEDHIMIITDKGTLIRTEIASVRVAGRNTQGVTLIKAKDEKVSSVARIAQSGDKDVDEAEVGEEVVEGEASGE